MSVRCAIHVEGDGLRRLRSECSPFLLLMFFFSGVRRQRWRTKRTAAGVGVLVGMGVGGKGRRVVGERDGVASNAPHLHHSCSRVFPYLVNRVVGGDVDDEQQVSYHPSHSQDQVL